MTTEKQADKTSITIVKVVGIITILGSVIGAFNWLSEMRTDLALIKQKIFYNNEINEVRISALEDCCNDKHNKQIVFNQAQAILPNSVNLENEN